MRKPTLTSIPQISQVLMRPVARRREERLVRIAEERPLSSIPVKARRVTLCFLSSYASKKRIFSSFRELGRLLFGEPLGGVGAPIVGADLCVRPSSHERSLFCGRTRRSAPTQATSARQFHSSNAVTQCRDARSVRPSPSKQDESSDSSYSSDLL